MNAQSTFTGPAGTRRPRPHARAEQSQGRPSDHMADQVGWVGGRGHDDNRRAWQPERVRAGRFSVLRGWGTGAGGLAPEGLQGGRPGSTPRGHRPAIVIFIWAVPL